MAATEVIWFPFRKQVDSGVRLILILRLTRLFDHPPPAIRTPESLHWRSHVQYRPCVYRSAYLCSH